MKLPFFQVAYKYPPINTVGVLRNKAISEMLISKGHLGTVVTSTHTPQVSGKIENLDIIRVGVIDYRSRRGQGANFSPSKEVKESLAYSLFSKVNNSYPFNLLLGEGAAFYIYNAYKNLDKLINRAQGKGILVSSFRPWADHQVAYLLKKKYPSLIWWSDWRDTPFEKRGSKPIAPNYQDKKLRQLLNRADLVTAVSAGVLHDLKPISCHNEVLYNGATNIDLEDAEQPIIKEDSTLSIVYTGSLYGNNRNPTPLFKAISELINDKEIRKSNFDLVYAGKDSLAWNELLNQIDSSLPAISKGLLTQKEAIVLQKRAAINILLTWCNPGQTGGITMKVFEYMRSGQPILRIHDGPKDAEIDDVLSKAVAPIFTHYVDDNNLDGLKRWLKEQLSSYKINPVVEGFELADTLENFYEISFVPKLKEGTYGF